MYKFLCLFYILICDLLNNKSVLFLNKLLCYKNNVKKKYWKEGII